MHPATLPINELLKECRIQRTRGSGPGGQHRNKVETAITIEHQPTKILSQASERRSQEQNRTVALHRLRVKLAVEFRTETCRDQQPSALWTQRIPGRVISVSTKHADYPALLAELLDAVCAHDGNVAAVAQQRGTSTSQITKFLKREPTALPIVNLWRAQADLSPLR